MQRYEHYFQTKKLNFRKVYRGIFFDSFVLEYILKQSELTLKNKILLTFLSFQIIFGQKIVFPHILK